MRRIGLLLLGLLIVWGCDAPIESIPDPEPPEPVVETPDESPPDEPITYTQTVTIQKNGKVTSNPQFPYIGHKYLFDQTPGDNDLPWLRQYASDHDVFDGVDMSAPWLEREWDMMKAIVFYTSHTLTFTGENTVPEMQFRARDILEAAAAHSDYTWACGTIAQVAAALAQAHGIPARMINGRTFDDPCIGDYCCEMFSTRFNRWVFVMPHVCAWIEHQDDGPLGVAELREYDLKGMIQATLVAEQTIQVPDGNGGWTTITIPEHWDAVPAPPLVFMPSSTNMAPIPPHRSVAWWSGWFHRFAMSHTTRTQSQSPLMLEVFNESLLNELPCFTWDPIPVVAANDPNITHPLNNVEARIMVGTDAVEVQLQHNMLNFVEYQFRQPNGSWIKLEVTPQQDADMFVWHPDANDTLTLRGMNLAGLSSPEVVIVAQTTANEPP